ncbi:MAG: quinone-dependent dihydroorotate dehydrogenase [Patescibacteria group bacterium]
MIYKYLIRPILFKIPPETVHDFFVNVGEYIGARSFYRKLIGIFYNYKSQDISKQIDGIHFRTPVIMAAGFDNNARLTQVLSSISFGGVEVGSITIRKCEGNKTPRLKRLPLTKGLLVNKGLRNDGVEKIISRIKNKPIEKDFVLGVSIARTNDLESSTVEKGIKDYVECLRILNKNNIGDYYTINISCPNSFGGETFTTPELLSNLMTALEDIKVTKPVYVKMPINLGWTEFDALLTVLDKSFIKGVIIGNLNKDYSLIHSEERPETYRGGISGEPCKSLSTNLTKLTRDKYGRRFTIISCGGIMSPHDAIEKFYAGADLVQLITGVIYKGPGLVKSICKSYAEHKKNFVN